MLHLYLIKNKFLRFCASFAETLLMFAVLFCPVYSYMGSFISLPHFLPVTLGVVALTQAFLQAPKHIKTDVSRRIEEWEQRQKPFAKDMLSYLLMGLGFGALVVAVTFLPTISGGGAKFGGWSIISSLIFTASVVLIGAVFHFANRAAYARLKEAEE